MSTAEPGTGPAPAVELVTIGDELLLGETVDGNSAWLGRRLAAAGIRVARRATVGDDDADIRRAVSAALDRTGTVLCTGGLGPTRDDRTRDAVAALFHRELRVDPALLDAIRRRFEARGVPMPELNRRQAEVPDGRKVDIRVASYNIGAGLDMDTALRGTKEQVAPIMTSAAGATGALLPVLFLGDIAGLEIVYPMAVVILGGLVTSTLFNVLLLPALYVRFGLSRGPLGTDGRTAEPVPQELGPRAAHPGA
jgi:molybdenum cofactor synthesis domain-containing protein